MYKKIAFFSFVISIINTGFADSLTSYFNHDPTRVYTDPYYHAKRIGDDLEAALLSEINAAKKAIDLAVYEIDLPLVAKALSRRKSEGIRVRIVLENLNSKEFRVLTPAEFSLLNEHDQAKYLEFFNFSDENRDGFVSEEEINAHDSIRILKQGMVPFIDDTADGSKGSGLMHHKFLITDNHTVITGSANFTRSCIHGDSNAPESIGNANSLLRIESQSVVRAFQEEFSEMWDRHHFGLKKTYRGRQPAHIGEIPVVVQFSPTSTKRAWSESTNGLISEEVLRARKTFEGAFFVFSEQNLVNSIRTVTELGLKPHVLIDPSFATRYYSELLDIFGLALRDPKCRFEPGNTPWIHPSLESGFPALPAGDLLHHKFAVIDGKTVLVGSHNWSEVANSVNDETLLVIDDVPLANDYSHEFRRLYSHSVIGPQPWLYRKIEEAEHQCSRKFDF